MADRIARNGPGQPTLRRNTFPSTMRILNSGDFSRVFKKNQRSKDASFTVLAHRTRDAGPRLGMAIARKSSGNAVQRNRMKRLVRETFRLSQHNLPSADFVVLARPGVAGRTNAELISSLQRHWQRFGTHRAARNQHRG